MKLTPTDRKVLHTLNGNEAEGITVWGAAVGASIEALRGAGYVKGYLEIEITDTGRAALKEAKHD